MKKIIWMACLLTFALGSFEMVWAGGAGSGGKASTTKLTKAQIEECAKDPKKLKELTKKKSSSVKADAVARVLDLIAGQSGVNDAKINDVINVAKEMGVSMFKVGANMKNSPYKNDILAKIKDSIGDVAANEYKKASGAQFPAPPAPPTENEQAPEKPPVAPGYPAQQGT